MAQAYLSYLLRLVSIGLIPIIAEVPIAAFRDEILKMQQRTPILFPPLLNANGYQHKLGRDLVAFFVRQKAAVVPLNVLIKIYFPSTLGPEGSSQLMRTKLLSI